MKQKSLLYGELIVLFWSLAAASQAMYLGENSIEEITTHPEHQVYGYEQTFAVSSGTAVWFDFRDTEWIPRVYGVNLSDPSHTEFIIDLNASGREYLAMSGTRITYPVQEFSGPQYLRVVDISNQSKPHLFDITLPTPYIGYLDISGARIAYTGIDPENNYQEIVYLADITDPNVVQQIPVFFMPEYDYVSGLTIDEDRIIWPRENADRSREVQIADISNPSAPNISTAILPEKISFNSLQASGAWLISCGQEGWQRRIFAVHNYWDTDNWDIQILWREGENGEYLISVPRVNGHIAVWVTTTSMPALSGLDSIDGQSQYLIKAAYLMDNGRFSISTLLADSNEIGYADISGTQVVWSCRQSEAEVTDLFKAEINLECGDWGYRTSDLNRDCKVDLKDLAIMSREWLACTQPEQENCEFGI